ncbi:hypothetical protein [Paraburkholderia sp. Tr-20389]|uniref:RraA family protein n=1 Tax=Paraburkholderia sp. Tr-20389 TaxID=2703903 RepID=UPI001F120626|nr:hypothetical protein [Paraburkholderia sp. Tr-20389]
MYPSIHQDRLPVFAAGATHRGPYKDGPGAINVPAAVWGMCVEPGDLIVGDADGLLCIPFDRVDQVLAAAQTKSAGEEKTLAEIAEGRLDTSWIDERLRSQGCAGI